jgi:hypothetical protein
VPYEGVRGELDELEAGDGADWDALDAGAQQSYYARARRAAAE